MNFINNIKSVKVKCIVECASFLDESVFAVTKAKIVSGELAIDSQGVYKTIEESANMLLKKPVTLVVNTNKVLTRKVAETAKSSQILSEAFPNLALEDFYYQIYTSPQSAFVSVVRKEYVHEIIRKFRDCEVEITNFVVGPIHVSGVQRFITNNKLETLGQAIVFDQEAKAITNIQPLQEVETKEYEVEGQIIESSNLLGVSVLINDLLGVTLESNIQEKNQELKKRYSEKQFFKNTLLYGVGGLLCVLLINAFVFNRNFSQIQSLQEEAQVFNSHKKQLENKRTQVKSKEAIVQSILNTGFSKSSFFVDRIIQVLPKSILLEQFGYQPLTRSIKKNKKIEIEKNVLEIKGTSNNKEEFNDWLKQLENFGFVNNVIIEEYGVVKGKEASFEIHLNTKEK